MVIELIHLYLRDISNENNVLDLFLLTSAMNETIEEYWPNLKRDRLCSWKNFSQNLIDYDLF